jgi:NADH-quinone oxidoreductase subunit N
LQLRRDIVAVAEGFESEEIADFAGLNQRSPFYAAVMAVCLLSLAGIPPMVGFYAKLPYCRPWSLLGAFYYLRVVSRYSDGIAVFAVLMSLIGAFYYLRVIKVMYFDASLP